MTRKSNPLHVLRALWRWFTGRRRPPIDLHALTRDEANAALLDGRLTKAQRADLLREIGTSDEDLETLVDSAELEMLLDSAGTLRDLEEEDRSGSKD